MQRRRVKVREEGTYPNALFEGSVPVDSHLWEVPMCLCVVGRRGSLLNGGFKGRKLDPKILECPAKEELDV